MTHKRREEAKEVVRTLDEVLHEMSEQLGPEFKAAYKSIEGNCQQVCDELDTGVADQHLDNKGPLHDLEIAGFRKAKRGYEEAKKGSS